MGQLHPLVEKLRHKNGCKTADEMNSIIRKWLEEKARAIKVRWDSGELNEYLHDILGLTDEGVKVVHSTGMNTDCSIGNNCLVCHPPQKQSWVCGYCQSTWSDCDNWVCCPVCTTTRPTTKPLVERLAEVIVNELDGREVDGGKIRRGWNYGLTNNLAQSAIDFLREHKEEL